jgi:FkbM family methyltransferase
MSLKILLRLVAWFPHAIDHRVPGASPRRTWLRARSVALETYPRDFVARVEPESFDFAGNTRDVIQRAIYLHGVWEPDITAWVRQFLRPGGLAVDIGANTGYYALLFSRLVGPMGTVVCFEPVPSIFGQLEANLRRNAATNVEPVRAALGEHNGTIEVFRAATDNIGNSSTQWEQGHTSEGEAPMRVGDEVLASRAAEVSLVKIDTEGDEMTVLSGMRGVVEAMPPGAAVLVEVTPDKLRLRGRAGADVWDFFGEHGWDAFRIRNDYDFASYAERTAAALEPLAELPDGRCDLVFVKPGRAG